MLAASLRPVRALNVIAVLLAIASGAQAQFYDPCIPCAQTVAIAPVTVMANPCPCLQPVTETVYREVPVTKYRTVERTVKKPVIRTAYEEREVTAYRTVNETRTAEIPGVTYQPCVECQQVTVNRSYWRTAWQPVPKLSPCQYDPRPGLAGELNRFSYSMRMAFTPNFIPRREFIPNVMAYNVPVTRMVAVPTTRTVTYNVAKLEPYTTTQTVARQVVEYVDTTVTAYEPYTEMQTVAVGTQTRYAFVDPIGGTSATAARPTPSATAKEQTVPSRTAEKDKPAPTPTDGNFRQLSHPQPKAPAAQPRQLETNLERKPAADSVSDARPVPSAVRVAGWRPSRTRTQEPVEGPALSVAAK